MVNIKRIKEYIQSHPNQTIWKYIQKNPHETQYLIGMSYEELQVIILKIISINEQNRLTDENRVVILVERDEKLNKFKHSVEAEILLLIFRCIPNFISSEPQTLSILFKVSELTIISIYEYWKPLEVFLFEETSESVISECSSEVWCFPEKQKTELENQSSKFGVTLGRDKWDFGTLNLESIQGFSNQICGNIVGKDSSNLQFNTKNQPLPHDGLFIRRNNEFGTRLNIGIKDLIDQGILIDQTNIRFDDFIALNTERVPSPEPSYSLAVSYGIAPIPLSQKRDERATHYLEIALKTSDISPLEHPKNKAPSANYIFVIDTSGSMSGDKLDDVKASIRELFQKMKEDDVIGIVIFNTQPKTLLKATRISQINIDKFSQIISGMTADGGTDINVALSFGIDEIKRYGSNNTLNHIYLFSDGNPNSGVTDWIKIRQNIDSKTRGNIRLSTFAFGSDANTKELDALAGLTGGKSTFVTNIDDIKLSLQDELNRREHLAALNVQIKLDIERDIEILYLYGHDLITEPAKRAAVLENVERAKEKAQEEFGVTPEVDLITEEEGIKIFVPDLAVGETYWLVFELGIPKEKSEIPIGQATVQYVDTFAHKNQKSEFTLAFAGNLPLDLVVEHSLALWTSEVAFYVLDDLYEKDTNTAQKRIEKHVSLLRAASSNLASHYIVDDAVTLSKFASLLGNLGKVRLISDVTPHQYQSFLVHEISDFGRARNGFRRVDYYSV
ncbi:VWA domain-containing protein [Scytonema hofmannii FACHB-248]|uniref:VWA domain-containing protein n=1 Tax=Scytonema hofmannii FACHB-248 TaxID=1842502 RepID=A0ABR8GS92_9CYAN|nr:MULTISPECIES: VWA domain-containing protein [Nostocales]MBD2606332.1 VWA domain-containing protein [Scytonema hofmannii FACHB-248]